MTTQADSNTPDQPKDCDVGDQSVVTSRSTRKPHNHLAGYRSELRSKHPMLPGHIVIFDRHNGGDWIDADERWVVMHINGDECGCMVAVGSNRSARDIMKHIANGGDDIDLGQHSSS